MASKSKSEPEAEVEEVKVKEATEIPTPETSKEPPPSPQKPRGKGLRSQKEGMIERSENGETFDMTEFDPDLVCYALRPCCSNPKCRAERDEGSEECSECGEKVPTSPQWVEEPWEISAIAVPQKVADLTEDLERDWARKRKQVRGKKKLGVPTVVRNSLAANAFVHLAVTGVKAYDEGQAVNTFDGTSSLDEGKRFLASLLYDGCVLGKARGNAARRTDLVLAILALGATIADPSSVEKQGKD